MPKHHQTSLFAAAQDNTASVVHALDQHKPVDKQQATFQRLLRQVDEQRSLLADWNAYHLRYNQRLGSELIPVFAEYRTKRCDMAQLLDTYWEKRVLKGKKLQYQLRNLLLDLLDTLLDEEDDEKLNALYTKHNGTSHADERAAEMEEAQEIFGNIFGFPRDGYDSQEELREKVQQKISSATANNNSEASQQKKRSPPREEAAKLKKEAAAKNISQTVREVYRKLASALHPDRETDTAIREEKTAQMQRVNQAYEAGDLLTLLNLQFEIEQIDTEHLTSLSTERLTHYNQVLREQLMELKAEVEAKTEQFRQMFSWKKKLTPQDVDREMSAEIANAQQGLEQIKEDLARLQNPAELRPFIEIVQSVPDYDTEEMLDIFLDSVMASQPTQKRGKKKTTKRC